MLTVVLIILLVLVLTGGGVGWQRGVVTPNNLLGVVLFSVLVLILLGLLVHLVPLERNPWTGPPGHRP